MTDTATATPEAPKAPLNVVLEEAEDFGPRTRQSTIDTLAALKPSLESVQGNPDKVFTIVKGLTPQKAASLTSLLNERHDNRWTFGGRSTDDGTAIVQARYSENPKLARPVRNMKPRAPKAAANGQKATKK